MHDIKGVGRRVYICLFRWRIRLRNTTGPQRFLAAVTLLLIGSVVPVWRHFGTDTSLPVLADATPILLAVVGVVMSYIQPKRESHLITTMVIFAAGIVGTAVLTLNRLHGEAAHRIEVGVLGQKLDAVSTQNTKLSNFLIAAKDSGKMSEAERREGIESTLRSEYIISQKTIDPQILAGDAMPPADWTNKRLAELGEHWSVAATPATPATTIVQQAPEQEKARLSFTLWDQAATGDQPVVSKFVRSDNDGNFLIEFAVYNSSEVWADSPVIWLTVCGGCSLVGEPQGFDRPSGMDEHTRHRVLPSLNAGTSTERMTALVKPPNDGPFQVGVHYACKNCGRQSGYQIATINPVGGVPVRPFKLHSPSSLYIPVPTPSLPSHEQLVKH
jgi:hypothetical protein